MQGGVDYTKQNDLMQVANLVLFDQVKELESINVDFKRHIERRNLGI